MMINPLGPAQFTPSPQKVYTHLKAFNFKLGLDLEGLKKSLEEKMGVKWFSGSKSFIGDYISVSQGTGSTIRIFEDGEGFAFDMLNKTGCAEEEYNKELADFRSILKDEGATDFAPTEDFY